MEDISPKLKIIFVLPKSGRILLKEVDSGKTHEVSITEFDSHSKVYKSGDVGVFKRMASGRIIFHIEGEIQDEEIKLIEHEKTAYDY